MFGGNPNQAWNQYSPQLGQYMQQQTGAHNNFGLDGMQGKMSIQPMAGTFSNSGPQTMTKNAGGFPSKTSMPVPGGPPIQPQGWPSIQAPKNPFVKPDYGDYQPLYPWDPTRSANVTPRHGTIGNWLPEMYRPPAEFDPNTAYGRAMLEDLGIQFEHWDSMVNKYNTMVDTAGRSNLMAQRDARSAQRQIPLSGTHAFRF